jgi:hypothetical protein
MIVSRRTLCAYLSKNVKKHTTTGAETMNAQKLSLSFLIVMAILPSLVVGQQTANSSAVVPRLVNFSGGAIDAMGKPVSGIAGATFSIYKDQYEGAPLWMETQNVHANAKGNYVAQLGATMPDGLRTVHFGRRKMARSPCEWLLPNDVSAFSALVRTRGLKEDDKPEDRSKLAGRTMLFQQGI